MNQEEKRVGLPVLSLYLSFSLDVYLYIITYDVQGDIRTTILYFIPAYSSTYVHSPMLFYYNINAMVIPKCYIKQKTFLGCNKA